MTKNNLKKINRHVHKPYLKIECTVFMKNSKGNVPSQMGRLQSFYRGLSDYPVFFLVVILLLLSSVPMMQIQKPEEDQYKYTYTKR